MQALAPWPTPPGPPRVDAPWSQAWLLTHDLRLTRALQRWALQPGWLGPLRLASRASDGLGYLFLLLLPLFDGLRGLHCMLQLLAVGALNLALYRLLKPACARERPCHRHVDIQAHFTVPDRYSFPSGHTLHAVGFSVVLCLHHPVLLWPAVPFAAAVAASRVALGLHYPSDVLAGAALGALTGLAGATGLGLTGLVARRWAGW